MKNRFFLLPIILSIFFPLSSIAQISKTWTQSNVSDFSAGAFNNTIVTNGGNGELRMAPPLVKVGNDTLDSRLPDYRILNHKHQYLTYRVAGVIIFVQKYDSLDNPVGPEIVINDSDKGCNYFGPSIGFSDNGYYFVAWQIGTTKVYGQLVDSIGNKISANQLLLSGTAGIPAVIANDADNMFWVYVTKTSGTTLASGVQFYRFGYDGGKNGPYKVKDQDSTICYDDVHAGIGRNGVITLVFHGSNSKILGGGEKLMFQHYTYKGAQSGAPQAVSDIDDVTYLFWNITYDDSGDYLITWSDDRQTPPQIDHGQYIYSQFYGSNDVKAGKNFLIDVPVSGFTANYNVIISTKDQSYRISWQSYMQMNGETRNFHNSWIINRSLVGIYTSQVHDAGPLIESYGNMVFNAQTPSVASLKFQLRSGNTQAEIDTAQWYGPSGSIEEYYTESGQAINSLHNLKRLLQYRAYFGTTEWGTGSVLSDLSITFLLSSGSAPQPPASLTAEGGHGVVSLSWTPSPSPNISAYKLYRGLSQGSYDSLWTKTFPSTQTTYSDTNVVNRTQYYYTVAAVDSNLLESGYSNESGAMPTGRIIYVATTGSDGGDGSIQNPYLTINEAMTHTMMYDTVQVLPGTYSENLTISPYVTLLGSGPRQTTVNVGNTQFGVYCKSHTILSNITINQNGPLSKYIAIYGAEGNVKIENNNVTTSFSPMTDYFAIFVQGENCVVRKNYIAGFDGGVSVSNYPTSATVSNNVIIVRTLGLAVEGETPTASLVNNTIIIKLMGDGIMVTSFDSVDICNNILVSSINPSLGVFGQYENSISTEYNDVWNFQPNYSDFVFWTNGISVDPLFVNSIGGDFRLRKDSPCRHAGDPASKYNNTDGSQNDLGAFGGPDPIDPNMVANLAIAVTINSASGFPSDTVNVALSVDNSAHISSAQFTIDYDPDIVEPVAIEKTTATSAFQLVVDTTKPGHLHISMNQPGELSGGKADLIKVWYLIVSANTVKQASPLTISEITLKDSSGLPLLLKQIQHGTIVLTSGSEGGRYVYVNGQNSSGTQDGTRYHPWLTVQSGIDHAQKGDTVLIEAGSYREAVILTDSIHLRGSGAGATIILVDSANAIGLSPTIKCMDIKGSVISGITFTSPASISAGFMDCISSDIEIYDCAFKGNDNTSSPLITVRGTSHASVHDNYFNSPNGLVFPISTNDSPVMRINRNIFDEATYGHAININGGWITIDNNRISVGAQTEPSIVIVESRQPVVIHNNLFRAGLFNGGGIYANNSDSIAIVNNTFDTRWMGINVINSSLNIMNNIVTGNTQYGIALSSGVSSTFNDVWGNSQNYSGGSTASGDISTDPEFINQASGNYQLQPGSPCRNAGNPDPSYNDLDSSRNDIGMYGGPGLDTTFFPRQGTSLQLPVTRKNMNDTIIVPLKGFKVRGVASAQFQITYDPSKITFIGSGTTGQTSAFTLSESENTPGILTLSMQGLNGIPSDSVSLMELRFMPRLSNTSSTVSFQSAKLYNAMSGEMPVAKMINGQVTITSVKASRILPTAFSLEQNYPNPFNPSTTVRYSVPKQSYVSLNVYNILGQLVVTLVSEVKQPGTYNVVWNGRNSFNNQLSSGVYFSVMQAGNYHKVIKMLYLR